MGSIQKHESKNGNSYQVQIRKKGIEIHKTFKTEEDANLFIFYRERLIDNMEAFDVTIEKRVTLEQLYEMKTKDIKPGKVYSDFLNSLQRIKPYFENKFFVEQHTYLDWLTAAKDLFSKEVYRGAKSERGRRIMSPKTLRRIFACASSVYSNAIAMGINVENLPLRVVQNYINPMIKKEEIT